ncbi:MAG: hypothetical protein ACI4XJ_08940 [Eubacteriales bacterium]
MITITRKKPIYESGIAKDGTPLNLIPASKKTFTEITETAANFAKDGSSAEKINDMYKLLAVIMNNNTAGIDVTAEELEEIDPVTAATIIKEYTAFMRGLQKDPN